MRRKYGSKPNQNQKSDILFQIYAYAKISYLFCSVFILHLYILTVKLLTKPNPKWCVLHYLNYNRRRIWIAKIPSPNHAWPSARCPKRPSSNPQSHHHPWNATKNNPKNSESSEPISPISLNTIQMSIKPKCKRKYRSLPPPWSQKHNPWDKRKIGHPIS